MWECGQYGSAALNAASGIAGRAGEYLFARLAARLQ